MHVANRYLAMIVAASAYLLAGCAGHGMPVMDDGMATNQMVGAAATAGPLSISGAYIPKPASADVAAMYFVAHNAGATPLVLTGIDTAAAESAGFHRYVTAPGGGQEMQPLSSITVPAGATVTLRPDAMHVMLEQPEPLAVGQTVAVTVDVADRPPITIDVPVVPMTGLQTAGDMPGMQMGG